MLQIIMATLSEKLRKRVLTKSLAIPRGAPSRIAEFVGVSPTTALTWLLGKHTPSKHVEIKLKEMLADHTAAYRDFDFSARKTGRKT